jgi:hypothetical protein
MFRRELLKVAAGGSLASIATSLLAPYVHADQPADTSEAAAALRELQARLSQLEQDFATNTWQLRTAQDFAEARRVTLHTLMHALQVWLEADPERPFFTAFISQHKKMLGDNPDARYYSAAISDAHSYRIRGNLADATYTSFTTEFDSASGDKGVGSTLNDTQFKADANGDYEIILSREKQAGNWMPLPAGATSITSRHYYEREQSINNDRLHHIPLDIANLAPTGARPTFSDASIAAGIRRVTQFVAKNIIPFSPGSSPEWVSRVPNQLPQPRQDSSNKDIAYAAVDNVYAMAPWLLQPHQALLIRGRLPRCRFANVVLWNRFMQTLDYETRQVSLNRRQITAADNGEFELILAHRDPQRANWLDTEGRAFGMIFWRFQLPEEEIAPLETEVITLS